ncbi:MAG: FkbM family methyltransferase [Gammaproteobacteria bacterium]|nr:FkbM family methyltransferase [Gammaproteobacteria bacterium]
MKSLLQLLWLTGGISLSWRKFLYRRLRRMGHTPDFSFEIDFYGLRYQGNLNNSIEASIFFYGAFEKPLLYFLHDIVQSLREKQPESFITFLDVGANVGQHSLYMSKFVDSVLAFEPFPPVIEQFKHQLSINQISNINLYEAGLSDQDQSLAFYAPSGPNQGIGSFSQTTTAKGNKETSKLPLYKGDNFLRKRLTTKISVIKIDVEGFERKVISGLKETLQENRPIIVCEISYTDQLSFRSKESLLSYLPSNYVLYRFNTRKLDGSKAKRRGSSAKRSGVYEVIELKEWRISGQDDVIAIPKEKIDIIRKDKSA